MIERERLPQIPQDQFDNFREFCQGHDVASAIMRTSAKNIKPIQKLLNKDKVRRLIKNPSALDTPVIVSQDMFLLDGHHRWCAELVADKDAKMNCVQFKCTLPKLVELAHLFEGSFIKSIDEATTYR